MTRFLLLLQALGFAAVSIAHMPAQNQQPLVSNQGDEFHPTLFYSRQKCETSLEDAFKEFRRITDNPPLFTGITTFAHLAAPACFSEDLPDGSYDIAFAGSPFDTGVIYRTGARFGPAGIRMGSRRLGKYSGHSVELDYNPFNSPFTVVDCGDAPATPMDNRVAIKQLEQAHQIITSRKPANESLLKHPKIITLGGDHTITLPALRNAYKQWGQLSIIHFDSHLDTFNPNSLKDIYGGITSNYSSVNHGTYFHIAKDEGLLKDDANIHAGVRLMLFDPVGDIEEDRRCGFDIIKATQMETLGIKGIVERLKARVGDNPVYISLDIDVLDPAFAPATGTAEPGGWTSREMLSIIEGLSGINLIGADIVEVAPAYDTNAETTTMAAAELLYEILIVMQMSPI